MFLFYSTFESHYVILIELGSETHVTYVERFFSILYVYTYTHKRQWFSTPAFSLSFYVGRRI
jgi:hypothetical protein